ncbi:hypothetical protein AX767_10130 [Variovorax sp. PAMC 28711]|nr:hypothetical protein AX767_10130 [Variovorax sp. PAMC 28711]
MDYTVDSDGRYVKDTESLRRVLNDAGVREVTQILLPYSASLQTAEVLFARVIAADGQVAEVPASAIFEQEPYASQNAPMFSDQKVKAIVMPQIKPGVRIHLKTRLTQRTPILPGAFSAVEFISPHSARRDFVFTVTAPAALPLHVQAIDLPHAREVLDDGRVRYTFRGETAEAVPPEPGSVARLDYSPRMVVSSMAGGAELAATYRALVGDPTRPTEHVAALARDITQGQTDRRAQAKALYDWVRLNIRYVNVVLARGGFVPRPLDTILANGYGDCKDSAVLLGALLRAVGLESTPVLINAGNSYWAPEPGAVEAFNHMITYVPTLDMYLDATGRYNRFDTLPGGDSGKRVLHVATGTWARTPLPSRSTLLSRQVIDVADDGSATVQAIARGEGEAASMLRANFAGIQAMPDAQLVNNLLAQAGANGTGTLRRPDTKADTRDADFSFDYSTRGFMDLPGPGAVRMPPALFPSIGPVVSGQRQLRKFPFPCPVGVVREEIELRLPANVKLLRTPGEETRVLQASGGQMTYRATHAQDGRVLKMAREIVNEASQAVCNSAPAAAQQTFVEQVERHMKAQTLYE